MPNVYEDPADLDPADLDRADQDRAGKNKAHTDRSAGVLLHPTSLPGSWGVGDFGPTAEDFLQWLADTGFSWWQVLPMTPPAKGQSPYTSLSAFAINPLLISVDRLVTEGLLCDHEARPFRLASAAACDFGGARRIKKALLSKAFERFRQAPGSLGAAMEAFCQDPLQKTWLEDWCLFAVLRRELEVESWWHWPEALRRRQADALVEARCRYRDQMDFERFVQFLAYRHWQAVKQVAGRLGIRILGDLPIYVAYESADVWTHPELFQLDDDLRPIHVAGVPPDYFSEDGQLWGNPLYRWDRLQEQGFQWWVERLRHNLYLTDAVRLDHFRAFADYWQVPAGASHARDGTWQLGPGIGFFDRLKQELGDPLPLVAEDLGDLSDRAHALRAQSGLPCMRVLHFGFGSPESEHATHNLAVDTLLYTGTHDNDTTAGWFADLDSAHKQRVLAYTGGNQENIHLHLVRLALSTVARRVVIPMQDILGLGSEARMNVPGVAEGNWDWRLVHMPGTSTSDASSATPSPTTGKLRDLIELTGRIRDRI